MADIKQAAEWMEQGHSVRRKGWPPGYYWKEHRSLPMVELHSANGTKQDAMFGVSDLLASNWEIAP
jgi:hypothetical protein